MKYNPITAIFSLFTNELTRWFSIYLASGLIWMMFFPMHWVAKVFWLALMLLNFHTMFVKGRTQGLQDSIDNYRSIINGKGKV